MLPCMNNELAGSLSKRGISVQQLLDFPKATLQTVIGNFPASKLYQVHIFGNIMLDIVRHIVFQLHGFTAKSYYDGITS